MKIESIKQIALHATNLDESEAFYRDVLGASFIARYDQPGLVFFDFSGVRLLLEQAAAVGTVYLAVDDIDASYEELKTKGVEFSEGPAQIFQDDDGTFGQKGEAEWMAFFQDPGGNTLAIASRK